MNLNCGTPSYPLKMPPTRSTRRSHRPIPRMSSPTLPPFPSIDQDDDEQEKSQFHAQVQALKDAAGESGISTAYTA
jgi:hypothetical protein